MTFPTIKVHYSGLYEKYRADYKANGYTSAWMFALREKLVNHWLTDLSTKVVSVLDAGCGNGYFFERVIKPGLGPTLRTAHGVDQVEKATSLAGSHYDRIFTGSVLELTLLTDRAYDLVISTEVFQYIDQPEWDIFFAQHVAVLRSGGHLILTLPNLQSLYRRIFRPEQHLFPVRYRASDIMGLAKRHALRSIGYCGIDLMQIIHTRTPDVLKQAVSFEHSFLFQKV